MSVKGGFMLKRTHYTNEVSQGEVILSGWVSIIRDLGNIKFLILRDREGIIQITIKKNFTDKKIVEIANNLNQEDVISLKGKVIKMKNAPHGIEIIPDEIEIINKSEKNLPLDLSGKIDSGLDIRLDWRALDLRKQEIVSIFKIQAKMIEKIEQYFRDRDYIQVFTPCLMGTASESGAEVFPVVYFEKDAFLRQDPQLHRQLLMASGFDKIFEIGPNWRAELSHTPRHLCEHRACAVELSFIENESETMKIEEDLIVNTINFIKEECRSELDALGKDLKAPKTPFPELRFPEVYKILEKFGKNIEFGGGYDRESETLLWRYVQDKYENDFFFVNHFPFKEKPFYVMKVDDNSEWARSVDLIYKGLELSSGGQREHRYDRLMNQINEKGISPKNIEWFTKLIKYGTPPHGGFCIGIERFLMQILEIENIREATLFPRTPERLLP